MANLHEFSAVEALLLLQGNEVDLLRRKRLICEGSLHCRTYAVAVAVQRNTDSRVIIEEMAMTMAKICSPPGVSDTKGGKQLRKMGQTARQTASQTDRQTELICLACQGNSMQK